MDQSKLKNVWSYTCVFMLWTRTLTFSPARIFKTEYRLSWLVFSWLPQYLKVTARTISRLGTTASLQILSNSSSSIHLTIDATENEDHFFVILPPAFTLPSTSERTRRDRRSINHKKNLNVHYTLTAWENVTHLFTDAHYMEDTLKGLPNIPFLMTYAFAALQ